MSVAIRVENLSKKYILQHRLAGRSRYVALRDVLAHKAASLFRRNNQSDATREEFWALRDVSFDVQRGEAVGIIGRNGAGKSTLLKLLSRITPPTKGRIEIEGRVASLLEVGTGFHPELTGRENIFLNGAILGMQRTEIRRKFDEIVAFAEVEKFLDTPVKRYSSGMYMRLAFAVAAHLEPEILVVDEVLAVGDSQFQKKCLARMSEISRSDRTILFVSHNLQAVRELCSRAIVIHQGQVRFSGPVNEGVRLYLEDIAREGMHRIRPGASDDASAPAAITRVDFLSSAGLSKAEFERSEAMEVRISFRTAVDIAEFDLAMAVHTADGTPLVSEVFSHGKTDRRLSKGEYSIGLHFDLCHFKAGQYSLTLYLSDREAPMAVLEKIPMPDIVDSTADPFLETKRWGVMRLPVEWSLSNNPS